ncbi:MAG: PilZ domain-containing protein [Thermodesulfobacteriota bacterium]|nr:PilZ domain-containing protein [Thermodesulfobacteriota bacterium]
MKEATERRKEKRFQAPPSAFVIHGPYFTSRAQIIDISMGGLAFRYPLVKKPSDELLELDILFARGSFYLGKVPVRIVSHGVAAKRPFDTIPMRRCSLQFGALTRHQKSQLGYFIQNFSAGEA